MAIDLNLDSLGYDQFFTTPPDTLPDHHEVGRVTQEWAGIYKVRTASDSFFAELPGKSHYRANSRSDLPAVGDWVLVERGAQERGMIRKTYERKTFLARKLAGKRISVQPIAANIDYVFIIQSADENFNLRRIERYLVAVHNSGAKPIILLSKSDLADPTFIQEKTAELRTVASDTPVLAYSTKTGEGLDMISQWITYAVTTCFVGSSGVGKSTLLNTLAGEKLEATKEVREADAKGRHTTTTRHLVQLDNGGIIIDTPGMREFGLWESQGGMEETFTDIAELGKDCRFSDCKHISEPNCAVKVAVGLNKLDQSRYESYLKLCEHVATMAAQKEVRAALVKKAEFKKMNQNLRSKLRQSGKK